MDLLTTWDHDDLIVTSHQAMVTAVFDFEDSSRKACETLPSFFSPYGLKVSTSRVVSLPSSLRPLRVRWEIGVDRSRKAFYRLTTEYKEAVITHLPTQVYFSTPYEKGYFCGKSFTPWVHFSRCLKEEKSLSGLDPLCFHLVRKVPAAV